MSLFWTFFCWIRTKTRNTVLRLIGLNPPIIKKNGLVITYEINDSIFAVVAKTDRKIKLSFVAHSKGEDVTKEILRFAGANQNFHGIPTTPSMLGYLELEISSSKGTKTFYENEVIELPTR